VTGDPYPDLLGDEWADAALGGAVHQALVDRTELSDADSRLLAALTRREPPLVTVDDDWPGSRSAAGDHGDVPAPASARRGPVVPVFREPSG